MFEAEAHGLNLLADKGLITIPHVIKYGCNDGKAYLLLEFIQSAYRQKHYWKSLGEQLAKLHRNTHGSFGLHFNNFIGALPQSNECMPSWIDFFVEKRLKVQAGLAYYNGLVGKDLLKKFERLYEKLPSILPEEQPALLHGDLWSGNVMVNSEGLPCLIDPAVYYGNREIELAFTQLFGGFDDDFYQAYQATFPLLPDFDERIEIYNLYPLLVHVNLFGRSYLSGVERLGFISNPIKFLKPCRVNKKSKKTYIS
jgi:fructosamine-3-kinase